MRCADSTYIYKSFDYGVTWARATAHVNCMTNPNIEVVPDAINNLYLHQSGGPGSPQVQATQDEGVTVYAKDGAGGTAIAGNIRDMSPIWTLP